MARGSVRGEGSESIRRFDLCFTNTLVTWGVLDICLCLGCCGVGCVGREEVKSLDGPGYGRVGWCYVCVNCESRFVV